MIKNVKLFKSVIFEMLSNIILYIGLIISIIISLGLYINYKSQILCIVSFIIMLITVVYISFKLSHNKGLYKYLPRNKKIK